MKTLKTIIAITIIAILASCSKSSDVVNSTPEPLAFKQFANLITTIGSKKVSGIDYSPSTKNLYIGIYPSVGDGFSIIQCNTETKLTTIVYNSPTTAGFGHPDRLRIFGNSIYAPIRDFGNEKIMKFDGIGTNTLTLANTITPPPITGLSWKAPYDIAIVNKMYLLNFFDGNNVRNKITVGDAPNFTNLTNFSVVNYLDIDSSLVHATFNNVPYLIICSRGNLMSVYNPSTGAFIRSVQSPPSITNPQNACALAKDSQGRVYNLTDKKIIRYSADLLSKEEFNIQNGSDVGQFAIAEEADKIIIYTYGFADNTNIGIKSITLPK